MSATGSYGHVTICQAADSALRYACGMFSENPAVEVSAIDATTLDSIPGVVCNGEGGEFVLKAIDATDPTKVTLTTALTADAALTVYKIK
jgi:hypothetical protein